MLSWLCFSLCLHLGFSLEASCISLQVECNWGIKNPFLCAVTAFKRLERLRIAQFWLFVRFNAFQVIREAFCAFQVASSSDWVFWEWNLGRESRLRRAHFRRGPSWNLFPCTACLCIWEILFMCKIRKLNQLKIPSSLKALRSCLKPAGLLTSPRPHRGSSALYPCQHSVFLLLPLLREKWIYRNSCYLHSEEMRSKFIVSKDFK